MVSLTTRTAPLKVVVVEDNSDARRFLKETLEQQGHEVVGEAANGTDMVRTVLTLEPDVVVFDIHLPRVNGLEALRQIHRERVVAAVAVTGDASLDLTRQALGEHILAYLVKPVDASQLGAALLLAWGQFCQWRELSHENTELRQTLEERKTIERAKTVLMKRHRLAEAEAHRRLQRGAMNNRTTMIRLARDILNGMDVRL